MTDKAASLLARKVPQLLFGQKRSAVLFLVGTDSSQLRLNLHLMFTQFTAFLHCALSTFGITFHIYSRQYTFIH